jgi:hypothetical protein
LLDKQGDSGEFEHSNGDDSDDDGLRISPDDSATGSLSFRRNVIKMLRWVARFFLVKNTKTGKSIPNYYKIYQIPIKYNKRL